MTDVTHTPRLTESEARRKANVLGAAVAAAKIGMPQIEVNRWMTGGVNATVSDRARTALAGG